MNKAVFLDRDGVINVEKGYIRSCSDIIFNKQIYRVLHSFQKQGYLLIIVTNQSGIDRGYLTKRDLRIIHQYLVHQLQRHQIKITGIYSCPSKDNSNYFRKPNPGMILKAKKKFNIDLKNSILIGDKKSDITAGKNAGIGCCILYQSNLVADFSVSKLENIKRIKYDNF